MSAHSYKAWWIRHYEENRAYFEGTLDHEDPWGMADLRLLNALDALYADAPNAIVRKFLSGSLALVDYAFAKVNFAEDKHVKGAFPHNRGQALRVRAFARALLEGQLSADDLSQASLDYEEWIRVGKTWDDQAECDYLTAARLALFAGDRQRFVALLKKKRSFKWHAEQHAALQAMAAEFEQSDVLENPELKSCFEQLFETYRNPEFRPKFYSQTALTRFELGVIWRMYFFSPGAFTWQKVIDSISE